MVTDDVALESMSEAFQALTTDYRLSLLYLARVICIEGPRGQAAEPADPGRRPPGHQAGLRHADRGPAMTTDPALVIDTAVGPANVLHRLALGVECLDAVTGRLVRTGVLVGREMDPLLLPRIHDPEWPCFSLPGKGVGRSYLRFDHTIPVHTPLRLRLVDPSRRFVPRRLELPLWTLAEILAAEAAPPVVPAASRLLRPWLWPGSAALLPSGMTVIRGTIRTGAAPVRWARLTAVRHGDVTVGHGHADERGEFPW